MKTAPERTSRMRRASAVGIASRGVSLVVGLITIPMLVHYLGPIRFGIWATVTSLTALLSFTDLGLSNGLVNVIADADAAEDRAAMRRDISSAVVLLSIVGTGLVVTVSLLGRIFDIGSLVSPAHQQAASEAVLVFVICFAVGIPFGTLMRIQMGLQDGVASYMWLALGNILGLVANVGVVTFGGSLPLAVAATTGGPVVAAALNAVVLFGFRRPWLSPRLVFASMSRMRDLLQTGALFFVIQACFAISYQSDALIIGHLLGAAAVTEYTVPMRLFYFAPVVQNFALLPFWPAVRNALTEGDVKWATTAFRRITVIGSGAVFLITIVLLLAGPRIISVWTSGEVSTSQGLLLALAGWAMTASLVTPFSYFLTGAGAIKFLVGTYTTMAIANVGLSIALGHLLGVAGVVLGTVTADVFCLILPALLYLPRLRASMRSSRQPLLASQPG